MKISLRKVYIISQVSVLAYSTIRVLLATLVDEFRGSILALWLIDVGTAFPYVWGVFRFITGKTLRQRLTGLTVAVPSFLAPYIYWYAMGDDYPWFVNGAVILFVLFALISETIRYQKAHKLR